MTPIASEELEIVHVYGVVPLDAEYGAVQVLRITSIELNAGPLPALAADAIHVVAYPGDSNRNRQYDAEDARLIARVGVGLDSGLVHSSPSLSSVAPGSALLFPTIDSLIIGDVTGIDGVSPLDASDVLRRVVGLPTPNIPDISILERQLSLALSNSAVREGLPVDSQVGSLTASDGTLTGPISTR